MPKIRLFRKGSVCRRLLSGFPSVPLSRQNCNMLEDRVHLSVGSRPISGYSMFRLHDAHHPPFLCRSPTGDGLDYFIYCATDTYFNYTWT